MTFEEILDHAIALLQRRGRLTYRALKRQFNLDDDYLEDLQAELIKGQRLAVDEEGEVLVWAGDTASVVAAPAAPAPVQAPLTYTPPTPGRQDPHLPQCSGRRAQTGHGAVCGPEGLHGA